MDSADAAVLVRGGRQTCGGDGWKRWRATALQNATLESFCGAGI